MDRFDTSRPDQVTDVAGSATVFASMRYLGLGTLVGLNYDGASDLNLTTSVQNTELKWPPRPGGIGVK